MAVRITPDTDIVTLRHNVMDAVYATPLADREQ